MRGLHAGVALAICLPWATASAQQASGEAEAGAAAAPETAAPKGEAQNTEGEAAAEAAASPAAAAAATPASPSCAPPCREGFTCLNGSCVSACNPPCDAGDRCTGEGRCVTAAPDSAATAASSELSSAELKAALVQREEEKKQNIQQWREAHRYDHHLIVGGSLRGTLLEARGTDDPDEDSADVVAAGYGLLQVGYMHNFVRYFGVMAQLSLGFGGVGLGSVRDYGSDEDYSDADGAFASLIELEVVPYAGNFGPFYIGPMGFVGYRGYDKEELQTEGQAGLTLRTYRLKKRAVGGAGLGMGVVLGRLQDLHLSWSVRSSFTERLPFEAAIGFGYRFGRFWSHATP